MSRTIPAQFSWLVENQEAAVSALRAFSYEPVSSAERQRVRQLLDALNTDVQPGAEPQPMALANRLSSPDFSWLPLRAAPQQQVANELESSQTSASQVLLFVARAVPPARFQSLSFGLIYPLILLAFAWIVLMGLSIIVIPTFHALFDSFGLVLPLPTRLLMSLSQFLVSGRWLWVLLFLTVAIAVWLLIRHRMPRINCSFAAGFRQRGNTSELLVVARFCRRIAEATAAGVSFAEAIRWAGAQCGNARYAKAAERLAEDGSQGELSAWSSAGARLFPANLLLALSADRESGQRINQPLLLTLADIYEERAAERSESGVTLLGIFAVVGVLCSVGFAALALFMPLIQLVTGLS